MKPSLAELVFVLSVMVGCGPTSSVEMEAEHGLDISAAELAETGSQPEVHFEPEVPDLRPELDLLPWDDMPTDHRTEPGQVGSPCESGEECLSGFCVQTPDGKACTMTCVSECPMGWECALHSPGLPDEVYLCVPRFASLCRPCMTNADCMMDGVPIPERLAAPIQPRAKASATG